LGGLTNFNELGSIINVPNINITYLALIYAFNGNPSPTNNLNFGFVDMSNNIIQQTTLPQLSSTNIDQPSIIEFELPTAITTLTPRCLRIAIYNGSIGGSNYINIRTVILGLK
jgi:hypothetical protein